MESSQSDLEAKFLYYWRILAPSLPKPTREHRFHHKRRFRWDFSWLAEFVAVELQGGIWMRTKSGRSAGHAYGKRMERDYEKLNLAQSLGWQVYYFTSGMLDRDPAACVNLVRSAIEARSRPMTTGSPQAPD